MENVWGACQYLSGIRGQVPRKADDCYTIQDSLNNTIFFNLILEE